jgi:hypothetical protein
MIGTFVLLFQEYIGMTSVGKSTKDWIGIYCILKILSFFALDLFKGFTQKTQNF